MSITQFGGACVGCALASLIVAGPAQATPLSSSVAALHSAVPSHVTDVYWRGHYWHGGWGWGPFYGGLAAGALVGAAAAAPYYYGPPAYYGPPPVYYEAPPAYYAPPPRGPVRQCWVDTDSSRGYGYWRPC